MIPGHKHLVFEEGLQSAWLYETLNPHVDELVVGGDHAEPRAEERQARCLWPGRKTARVGNVEKHRLQGTASSSARLREFSRTHMTLVTDAGTRAGTDQERVPLSAASWWRARNVLRYPSARGTGRSSCVLHLAGESG